MSNELLMTPEIPFAQTIRVKKAAEIWATIEELEVKAQLRKDNSQRSDLIEDLHDFMTWEFSGLDLVITWVMTGAETKTLCEKEWGFFRKGYSDVVVSDVGVANARAISIPIVLKAGAILTTEGV